MLLEDEHHRRDEGRVDGCEFPVEIGPALPLGRVLGGAEGVLRLRHPRLQLGAPGDSGVPLNLRRKGVARSTLQRFIKSG